MKRFWQLLVLGYLACGVPTTICAQRPTSLGLNFAATDPDAATSSLLPTDEAGVIPQLNWNNLEMATGTSGPLVYDNMGTAVNSTAAVSWTSNNTWRSGANQAFPDGANQRLMSGYLDTLDTAGAGASVTVSNIDAAILAQPYDVYVYFVSDNPGDRGGAYTLTPDGGSPIVQYGSTLATPTMHVLDPGTDMDNSIDGTYLKFSGLTASGFTVVSDASLTTPNGFRAPINAIQISAPFVDLPGDVDGNQVVDMTDFNILRGNLFKTGQGRFDGDIVGADGIVNFADYRELKDVLDGMGISVSLSDVTVPEPASALVLAIGVALGAFAMRRDVRNAFRSTR